jgi:hypothetical protein
MDLKGVRLWKVRLVLIGDTDEDNKVTQQYDKE